MDHFLQLKHPVDLRVDYAFKIIFATKGNEPIVVDFLNVFLKPKIPIKSITLLNPYNDKEFKSEKLSIVDVKAEDENGNIYQIEMQIGNKPYLEHRMLFTWSQIYSKQVKSGDSVRQLNPVISIWILTENLIPDNIFHHIVEARYRHNKKLFIDHMEIHLLELSKWRPPKRFTKKHLWPYIFNGPHDKFELPILFKSPIMRRVMAELREISEKEIKWHKYLSRQLYLHDLATEKDVREEREKYWAEKEKTWTEKEKVWMESEKVWMESEKARMESEKARIEALKALEEKETQLQAAKQKQAELLEQLAQLQATKS